MNHAVVWLESAEQELAKLWLGAVDRDAITDAAGLIDQLLATSLLMRPGIREFDPDRGHIY